MKPRNHKAEFMDIMDNIYKWYHTIIHSTIYIIGVLAMIYAVIYSVREKIHRDRLIEEAAQTIIQQNNNQ